MLDLRTLLVTDNEESYDSICVIRLKTSLEKAGQIGEIR